MGVSVGGYNPYSNSNTNEVTLMRLTSKGQVTIPQRIRELAGIAPGSEVEFEFANGQVILQKAAVDEQHRRQRLLATLREITGSATAQPPMRTDDILAMTRGED